MGADILMGSDPHTVTPCDRGPGRGSGWRTPGGKAFDLGLEGWVEGSQEKERYFRQKPQDVLIGVEDPISLGLGSSPVGLDHSAMAMGGLDRAHRGEGWLRPS